MTNTQITLADVAAAKFNFAQAIRFGTPDLEPLRAVANKLTAEYFAGKGIETPTAADRIQLDGELREFARAARRAARNN